MQDLWALFSLDPGWKLINSIILMTLMMDIKFGLPLLFYPSYQLWLIHSARPRSLIWNLLLLTWPVVPRCPLHLPLSWPSFASLVTLQEYNPPFPPIASPRSLPKILTTLFMTSHQHYPFKIFDSATSLVQYPPFVYLP